MEKNNRTLSLSVLSGKGGVGKTSLAVNLAFGLHDMNMNTLLVDCDLGLANLDVMLGVSPGKNIHDVLKHGLSLEETVCRLEKRGLDLIPSASGVVGVPELDEGRRLFIIEKLNNFLSDYRFLIMDLGAGIGPTVLSFARMTHRRVVVVTPEPTSLTDAYALIKVLFMRHGVADFDVLVNMARSEEEAVAGYERIRAACDKFLGLPVRYLGHVRRDDMVSKSVSRQKALVRFAPRSPAAEDISRIVERLSEMRADARDDIAGVSPLSPDRAD
ncbi:MAG TPA: MinD/ParA family protein [Deltaproteobacteria bacterium]|nr:MinD/ParA family protein [Deltaproteobacteria bacterium]